MNRDDWRRWARRLRIAILLFVAGVAAACWVVQSTPFEAFLVRSLPGWARAAGLRLELGSLDFDFADLSVNVGRVRVEHVKGDWSARADRLSLGLNLGKSLAGTPHLRFEADSPKFTGQAHLAEESSFKMPDVVLDTVSVTEGSFSLLDLDSGARIAVPEIEVRWLGGRGWGRAAGGGVSWKGSEEHLKEVSLLGSRRLGVLHVERAGLATDRLRLSLSGRMGRKRLLDADVDAQVFLRKLPDAWLVALGLGDYLPVDGALAVRGRLTGRLAEPRFRGGATLGAGRLGPLRLDGATVSLTATEKELGFEKLALRTDAGSARDVSGAVSWARGVRLKAKGRADSYDLRPFMALFVKDFFPVGLKASGTFEAEGPLSPELDLACKLDAEGTGLDVTTREDGRATTWFSLPRGKVTSSCRVKEDYVTFGPTVVDGGSMVVRMPSGRVDYETGLDFTTDVEIANLDLVRQYLPEERGRIDVRGRAQGRMKGPYEAINFGYRLALDATTLWGRPLGSFHGDATFDLTDLVVSRGTLRGPLGKVEASGRARLRTGGPLALDAVWSGGDLAAVGALIRVAAPSFPSDLKGAATGVGRVLGTIDEPVFHGTVFADAVRAQGADVENVRVEGALGLTRWQCDRLALSAYGARLEAKGWADLDTFQAEGTARGLSLARLDKLFGKPMPVGAVFTGTFRGHGPYEQTDADLAGSFVQGEVTGYKLGDGIVTGGLRRKELNFDVKAFAGAAKANVRIGLEGARPLVVDAEVRDVPWKLVPPGLVPELLQGDSASGKGKVLGALSEGGGVTSARWDGTVARARAKNLKIGTLGTKVEYDGRDLRVLLDAWGGEAKADLTLRPGESGVPMRARAEAKGFNLAHLADLVPDSAGRVSATGEALVDLEVLKKSEGWKLLNALEDLDVSGSASGVAGPKGLKVPPLAFKVSNPQGRPELVVRAEGVEARGALEDVDRVAWSAKAVLKGARLASFLADGEAGGAVDGELEARGTGGKLLQGTARGEARDAAWGPVAPTRWAWSAKLAGGLASFELKESRGIAAAGTWTERDGLAATVRLDGVPLAGWTRAGVLPEDLRGTVAGSCDVRVPPKGKPLATLRVQRLNAELPPLKVENRGDLVASYRDGAVRLDAVNLSGEGFNLHGEGSFVPLKSWDVKVKGRGSLALAARATSKVRAASGAIVAEVAASGPWKNPSVEGPVEISGARLALEGLDYAFEDLKAKGYLEAGRGLLIDSFDARFGEGRLHAEGLVGAEGLTPKTLRVLVEARDVAYEWPKQVTYRLDGDGIVTGTPARPEIRGEVRLKQLRYTRRVNWKSIVFDYLKRRPLSVESAAREQGPYLDLSIRGAQDLKIENNLADLYLTVDVRVRGPLYRTIWLGRVESREGTVKFRSQEYDVLRSAVEFLGQTQPVPLLDLHGRTSVQQYTVNVDVDGPLDKYQVTLSSTPALAQNDLVRLLSSGASMDKTALSELSSGGQGAGSFGPRESKQSSDYSGPAAEATSLITGQVQDEIESQVTDLLGFDQFHLDPAYSTANQTTVPRVTVGKSITQSVFARYSTAIGGEVEQDVEVQYTLTPSVQLLGTWSDKGAQSKGSVGGKVRFRFTFR